MNDTRQHSHPEAPASQRGAAALATVLIAGASGSAGSAIAAGFRQDTATRVLELGRTARPSDERHIAADLLVPGQLAGAAGPLRQVTHLVFAARLVDAKGREDRDLNGQALDNLLAAMVHAGSPLRRIVLIHGTKWYGSHLGRYLVPAVETDCAAEPHFYHVQQAIAERHAQRHHAEWSALRPHTVFGYSPNPRHNLLLLLGLYAAMCVHEGVPLCFPGSAERFTLPTTATDADMLSQATVWAATSPAAANEAFNVSNGDALVWQSLWPSLCAHFGAAVGAARQIRLADAMPAKADAWRRLVERHGLAPTPWPDAADWAYADGILGAARVDIISNAKLSAAGFAHAADTHASILALMRRFRTQRLLP